MNSAEVYAVPARRALSANYPWILIGLLWLVAFLNAADRSILVAVMPKLREEFGLTNEHLALINTAFFWMYGVAAFVFGRLGDTSRRSWVIVGGLAFWSVATGLVSLATGFSMLLALRGMVALGEATYYPTGTALISDWHRPAMRSRALSMHQTAVLAGAGFGAYAAGLIADRLGWQAPFVIFAVAGIVWCVVLYKTLHDAPARAAHTNSEARKSLLGPLRVVLKRPPALFLCAVFFLGTGASTGVTVWAPTYVHDALGLELGDSALYGAVTISIAGLMAHPARRTARRLARGAHAGRPLLYPGNRARTGGYPVAAAHGRKVGDGDRRGAARVELRQGHLRRLHLLDDARRRPE